jgi:excisionase family DNA binding protein
MSAGSRSEVREGRPPGCGCCTPRPRARALVAFEKRAANDGPAQSPRSDDMDGDGAWGLDKLIREIVRAEVRAEVARVIAQGPAQPTHVSVAEYAAARSISVSTVRNAIRAGRLPAIRIGTAVRVPVEAEIGRPVIATADGRDANPVTRAEKILTDRIARSFGESDARRVA